jgi:menaquinone-9 beta-reductase
MHCKVVIVGAGPAGLACAKILAQNSIRTIIIDKKEIIGPKVCAGGLTWSGLTGRIPESLFEKSFPVQHINTPLQKISIKSPHPIIVTINRKILGQFMLEQALAAGAEILSGTCVTEITDNAVFFRTIKNKTLKTIQFDYLVGADGSNSIVRKFLSLPTSRMGVGINYQIPGDQKSMAWFLNHSFFKNGYGWIFPHKDTISIGAYVDRSIMRAYTLKTNLIHWAKSIGFDLANKKCGAAYINFDYQGWNFKNILLAGDAAGLASGLTGEGIYPAIISGEVVAKTIINPNCDPNQLIRLIKKQKLHALMVGITRRHKLFNTLLSETVVFGLRSKLLNFRRLEMAE